MSIETQPERTRLAWARTGLDLLLVSAVFLRWAPIAGVLAVAPVALSLLFAVGLLIAQARRYSSLRLEDTTEEGALPSIALTTLGVVLLAVLALVAVALDGRAM